MTKTMTFTGIALGALLMLMTEGALYLFLTVAHAQQTTVYGKDGKVQNRITTDSQGSKTIYDAQTGRITGRTSTDSQGTTTIYDASGNKAGTVVGKDGKR
jgi:YD repeat-containing protein